MHVVFDAQFEAAQRLEHGESMDPVKTATRMPYCVVWLVKRFLQWKVKRGLCIESWSLSSPSSSCRREQGDEQLDAIFRKCSINLLDIRRIYKHMYKHTMLPAVVLLLLVVPNHAAVVRDAAPTVVAAAVWDCCCGC